MKNLKIKNIEKNILNMPIEIVYFVFPVCDGNCGHCWSSDMQLGTIISLEQHKNNLDKLLNLNISELKLSGGEPFLNKSLGKIVAYIKSKCKKTRITIFTSGRPFISTCEGDLGALDTYTNLKSIFESFDGISLQLSADEYHASVLKAKNKGSSKTAVELMTIHVNNFIRACEMIKKEEKDFDFKLKIHANRGRIDYHRKTLYSWLSNDFWDSHVIATEGLIQSGNAKNILESTKIVPSEMWSLFALPGTDFVKKASTFIDEFYDDEFGENLYLIPKKDECIVIAGWWNLIERKACYFKLSDVE